MSDVRQRLLRDFVTRATKRAGDVEIGGVFGQPHLSVSYARAAHVLRDAAGSSADQADVVAPMFFCVRHAVEVALKDLLAAYQGNQLTRAEIEAHDGATPTTKPLSTVTLRGLGTSHDLGELLGWVNQWMPKYVTPTWLVLVVAIEKYEQSAVERFRYCGFRPW